MRRIVKGAATWTAAAALLAGNVALSVAIDQARANAATTRPARTTCATQLAAMRTVSRQAGVVVGSRHISEGVLSTGPRTWARELRRGGLPEVAKAALAIHDRKSDEAFVLALTSAAAADLADAAAHRACRG